MARPKGMPPEKTGKPSDGPDGDAPEVLDPLKGFHLRPGSRGPRSTLTQAMIPLLATSLARTGVLRVAAAEAGVTEKCLSGWLSKGRDAADRRKTSLYTELLVACEQAWAHRTSYLVALGERTVVDRHANPRFLTWLLAVTSPKQFTVPRELATQAPGGALGPAFELVTPEAAAKSVREKLLHFLAEEDRSQASPPAPAEAAPTGGG